MNEVKIFEHPKFGKIRTLIEPDGSPLFCGNDAATALEYVKPQNAIATHCPHALKRGVGVQTGVKADGTPAMQTIEMLFITEGDLYRLAAGSEMPKAKEFESWIFDEVLPSIRRTGTYSLPGAQQTTGFPHKASSLGEAATIIKALDRIMTREKQPPEAIARMAEGICQYCGIPLPSDFVKRDPFVQLTLIGFVSQ